MKRMAVNPSFSDETRAKYAASFDRKLGPVALWPERLEQPLHWRKPQTVFVVSQGDLFHKDVPFAFVGKIFGTIHHCKKHTFLVLTKRPKRMADFLEWYRKYWLGEGFESAYPAEYGNVWLGVSVEDQKTADERIPLLLSIPATHRFVSIEPMLGPVDIEDWLHLESTDHEYPCDATEGGYPEHCRYHPGCEGCTPQPQNYIQPLDWVIVGGESGKMARPMHPDWARKVRDDCKAAGVPFMFKQWGEWAPDRLGIYENVHSGVGMDEPCPMFRVGKKRAGRLLDGVLHDGRPGE